MEEKNYFENDFNPEFSEYNPMLNDLNKKAQKEDEGFIAFLIKKLKTNVVVTEW